MREIVGYVTFKKASNIGLAVIVGLTTGENVSGVVKSVNDDNMTIVDNLGLRHTITGEDILRISLDDFDSSKDSQKDSLLKLDKHVKQKNNLATKANFNLMREYREDITSLIEKSDSLALKEVLSVNRIVDIPYLDEEAYSLCKEEIDRIRENVSYQAFLIGNVILSFASKQYSKSVEIMTAEMDFTFSKHDTCYLILAYICNLMRDFEQTFFWLTTHFETCGSINDSPLWWYFLQQTTVYASYEDLDNMIQKVILTDAVLACESLAYIFAIINLRSYACELLEKSQCAKTEVTQMVAFLLTRLHSDVDNNYHRFLKCLRAILHGDRMKKYTDDERITGYVYDFVSTRAYGSIIGYDLLRYFFHFENCHNYVKQQIKERICSLKTVSEEEIVTVSFNRSNESKRTYEALNIV